MKNPWVIIGVITVVLFGGAFWYADKAAEKNNEGVEIIQHIKGNPDASVTLVEYSDLQCPACAAFLPAVNEVMDLYGDDVRFEYKHFPLPIHRYAVQAAMAAEAAGQQDRFFEYHDLLFENQPAWSQSTAPQTLFMQYAEELELDMETFRRHMNASALRDHIQSQMAEGRSLEVSATPTFFLNGEQMDPDEFQTFEGFIAEVGRAVNGGEEATDGASTDSGLNVEFGI